jgi:flagellar motility protein MotE (MotC chaperone)
MTKSQLIILVLAGTVSFVGSFGTTWICKGKESAMTSAIAQSTESYATTQGSTPEINSDHARIVAGSQSLSKAMTQKQLNSLIYDIREKMKELHRREKDLTNQEKRIETARDTLQQDIDNLNNLRVELTTTFAGLKSQEDNLKKTMIEIKDIEKTNMQRIASTYDKMDVTQASKIIINMAAGNQLNDAVIILHYMTERTAGKLLGEIGNTQAELAAVLCQHLKRVKENG